MPEADPGQSARRVCPVCPQPRQTQYSGGGDKGDICEIHGWVDAVEVFHLAPLRAKLAEMELHENLPNSHNIGYMAAWREIKEWVDAL